MYNRFNTFLQRLIAQVVCLGPDAKRFGASEVERRKKKMTALQWPIACQVAKSWCVFLALVGKKSKQLMMNSLAVLVIGIAPTALRNMAVNVIVCHKPMCGNNLRFNKHSPLFVGRWPFAGAPLYHVKSAWI